MMSTIWKDIRKVRMKSEKKETMLERKREMSSMNNLRKAKLTKIMTRFR
jgi:hypothetical protein